jgi:alpha-glucosidase
MPASNHRTQVGARTRAAAGATAGALGLAALLAFADVAAASDPRADPAAIVTVGQARFTVLTPRLVRLEWAADRRFEDRPSIVFVNRRLPVPPFTTRRDGDRHEIDTGPLRIRYRPAADARGRGFTPDSLSIEVDVAGERVTWRPGLDATGNLRGTVRTLDGIEGPTALEPGLVSRDGWAVVDDSRRPLFDDSDWPWALARPERPAVDWYFFGHGRDYKGALADFVAVAGRIPMPPRFAFGAWWSRYWAYSDTELMDLVREFEAHDVPLDVLVIDMDWHVTFGAQWFTRARDQAGHILGWTGYTWNRTLFPDPRAFLAWLEARGLKTTLNLHPASGVQPHEEAYPEMARAMGIDPATRRYVPFDLTDRRFAEAYLKLLHHPREDEGVDFWWLDWQQKPETPIPGLNATWWLNYVHFTDMERRGRRPLIFHRWGGLGNHRYQIGFSGDTVSVWESLAFQPYFTATAANVGYAYWSHDIGGHQPGVVSPELYTRWVQFGAFSPILRTHTTKNPDAERRIWAYPPDHARAMRDAFLLRYALVPYLYTEARRTYDTGVAFLRPLYYDYPGEPLAYETPAQYTFGEAMMAAPITHPMDPATGLARQGLWLPPGRWIEWFTGTPLEGGRTATRAFLLDEIPVYVKAGAIVPMQPKMRSTGERPLDPLVLAIFPGEHGETRVYEDEGDTPGYKTGAHAWTPVRVQRTGADALVVRVLPLEGRYPGMPAERGYELRLLNTLPARRVAWQGREVGFARDGVGPAPCWSYDGRTLTTVIRVPRSPVDEPVEVTFASPLRWDEADALVAGVRGRLARLAQAMQLLNRSWPKAWAPDVLVEAAQTGRRIELNPASAERELRDLDRKVGEAIAAVRSLAVDPATVARVLALLEDR